MDRSILVGGIVILVVAVAGIGAAVYYGIGPAPGGSDSGEELTDFPTATPSGDDTAAGGSTATTPAGTATPAPFTFTIDSIEECGQTCRDVTATLTNNQAETATDVTVFTRMFAGEDNTNEDDLVWEGKEEVGTLEAGASHTNTERVELSLQEANKIQNNDGWITLVTTVDSQEIRVTFRESQQVT